MIYHYTKQNTRDDELFNRHIRALGTIARFLFGRGSTHGVCFTNGKMHAFSI